jgi:hypothetical protein
MGSITAEAYKSFQSWEKWMESQRDSALIDWEELDFAARAGLYYLFCIWAAEQVIPPKINFDLGCR